MDLRKGAGGETPGKGKLRRRLALFQLKWKPKCLGNYKLIFHKAVSSALTTGSHCGSERRDDKRGVSGFNYM